MAKHSIDDQADTLPFQPIDEPSPWQLPPVDLDGDVEAPERKVPEPALVRGAIVAVVGLLSAILGYQLDVTWIEPAIALYVVAAPVGLSWWIRRGVTPVKK